MTDSGVPVDGERIDAADLSAGLVPAGVILPYGGASAPTGYLLCDGSAVSRATYATLFAAISTAFGSGDGSTTFNVPDLRERAPIGKGTVTGFTAVGGSDGVAEASRAPSHTHTGPSHTHAQNTTGETNANNSAEWISAANATGGGMFTSSGSGSHVHLASGVASGGTGATGATAQPYVVVNYIIKT